MHLHQFLPSRYVDGSELQVTFLPITLLLLASLQCILRLNRAGIAVHRKIPCMDVHRHVSFDSLHSSYSDILASNTRHWTGRHLCFLPDLQAPHHRIGTFWLQHVFWTLSSSSRHGRAASYTRCRSSGHTTCTWLYVVPYELQLLVKLLVRCHLWLQSQLSLAELPWHFRMGKSQDCSDPV